MRGEFLGVWEYTWGEIWEPLSKPFYTTEDKGWYVKNANAEGEDEWEFETPEEHEDLFCELFRTINKSLKNPYDEATELADIVDDTSQASEAFRALDAKHFQGESVVRGFFEDVYIILDEVFESENFKNKYVNLLSRFIEKYSLRYVIKEPFILVPTLPGIFSSLQREFQSNVSSNSHLQQLSSEFEEALKSYRLEQTSTRLKECIRLQINLLEGYGKSNLHSKKQKTLGKIAQTLCPHKGVSKAVEAIYEFANDYPGLRHAGTPENKIRELELRDLLVVSLQLSSCLPYFSENLNPERIYGGSVN